MDDTLIRVEHLSRHFGALRAVDGVSFEVRRGEVLGFLGPNGAGKSTTMQMLTGNLAPTTGRITLNGIDLLERPRAAKACVGYLPEQPPLYRELTVDEYLALCARLNRIPRREARAAVGRAKSRCGLESAGGRLIGNLSKGYQQRVGIAQAIIHTPPVVILDEPTVGLDPIQIREIRALIAELGREHSVILSTHILPEVQTVCSRVLIIDRGRLVLSESLEDLNRGLGETGLRVAFEQPPADTAAIASLPGVTSIQDLGDGRLRVCHGPDAEPAAALARLAAERGWGLTELSPERRTLEQVFVELVHQDGNRAENAA